MHWWERALPLCAAVLLIAGCDLRPVTDQVSVIDTFAVPSSTERSVQASDDTIPHVVAEPIETEPPAAGGNPNEHRSHADASVPADVPSSEPAPADEVTDEPDDGGATEAAEASRTTGARSDDAPSATADEADEPASAPDRDESSPAATVSSAPTAPAAAEATPSAATTAPVPLSAIEGQIVDLLNAEREAAGLRPLSVDARLTHGARAWATTMARDATFEHESEDGFSENIAYGYADAAQVHDAWMTSAGHRANRMRPGLTSYGIGVRAAGTTLYFAERFQ